MPLFEYECNDCKKKFDQLVFNEKHVTCKYCDSKNLKKLFSTFSTSSSGSSVSSDTCPTGVCPTCLT